MFAHLCVYVLEWVHTEARGRQVSSTFFFFLKTRPFTKPVVQGLAELAFPGAPVVLLFLWELSHLSSPAAKHVRRFSELCSTPMQMHWTGSPTISTWDILPRSKVVHYEWVTVDTPSTTIFPVPVCIAVLLMPVETWGCYQESTLILLLASLALQSTVVCFLRVKPPVSAFWNYKWATMLACHLCGFWGPKLWSLCLSHKSPNYWGSFPAHLTNVLPK